MKMTNDYIEVHIMNYNFIRNEFIAAKAFSEMRSGRYMKTIS